MVSCVVFFSVKICDHIWIPQTLKYYHLSDKDAHIHNSRHLTFGLLVLL